MALQIKVRHFSGSFARTAGEVSANILSQSPAFTASEYSRTVVMATSVACAAKLHAARRIEADMNECGRRAVMAWTLALRSHAHIGQLLISNCRNALAARLSARAVVAAFGLKPSDREVKTEGLYDARQFAFARGLPAALDDKQSLNHEIALRNDGRVQRMGK